MKTVRDVISVLKGQPGGVIGTLGVSSVGSGMLVVSLPLYLAAVHATPSEIGLTLSMFGVGMFVFEFLWGWLADRFGVPGPLIVSRLLFALSMLGFAFANNVVEFALLYLLSSGMMVAGGPLGRSFLGVSLPRERRGVGLGLHTSVQTFANAGGALVAGVMTDHLGITSVFQVAWLSPLLSAVIAVIAFRGQYGLKLTHIVARTTPTAHVERNFKFWYGITAISIVVMLMLVGQSGERSFLPLLVTVKLAHPATDAGLAVAVLGLAGGFLMIPAGTMSDRFGRKPVILAGLAMCLVGLVLYAVAPAFWVVLVAVCVRALGNALAWPTATALVADISPRSRQGLIMGIYGEFENVGMTSGPIIAGYAWGMAGIPAAFTSIAGFVLLALVLGALLIREDAWRRRASEQVEAVPA